MSYKPWEQTAQLQFKNCLNFSQNEQVRGGCRGGRDQFSWDALRTMKYNDRIHYLGQTVVIGYLDKGGKWRKRDWYTKKTDDDTKRVYDPSDISDEIRRVQEEDQRRIRVAMGLEKPDDKKDKDTGNQLSKEEMAELVKRQEPERIMFQEHDPQHKGLGLENKGAIAKPNIHINPNGQSILEAYGIQDDYKKNQATEGVAPVDKKIKKEKKEKKEKKHKKEKKDKKEKKKHHRKHSSSSSD